jgi:hypothetical protein
MPEGNLGRFPSRSGSPRSIAGYLAPNLEGSHPVAVRGFARRRPATDEHRRGQGPGTLFSFEGASPRAP